MRARNRYGWMAATLMAPFIMAFQSDVRNPPADLRSKASLILDHSGELSRIWPGYWPENQGFILYDPSSGAVLVGADGQPRNVTYRDGKLPGADSDFVFDYPAGTPNMMMMTVKNDWPLAVETLFHEQFHDFQHDAFDKKDRRYGGDYVDLTEITDRASFTAAAELERRVLADAILAQTAAKRTELSRQYVALRRIRETTLGEAIVGKERYFERLEGTAQYVGFKAAAIVLTGEDGSVATQLATGLRRNLFANAKGSYSGNWFRTRAYDVGGAIALLLDQLGPSDWKARVQSGEPLDILLEKALGITDNNERTRLGRTAQATYGAGQILLEMKAALAAAPKTLESPADFMRLGSRHLVLSISIPRSRLADGQEFSSTKQMIAVGRAAMAFLDVNNFQVEQPGIKLALKGYSVMSERAPSKPGEALLTTYTISLSPQVKLPTLDALAPGTHSLDSLNVSTEGLTLHVDRPTTVTVTKDRIAVLTSVASQP